MITQTKNLRPARASFYLVRFLADFFSSLAACTLLYALTRSGTCGRPAVTFAAGEEIRRIDDDDDDVDDEAALAAELCDGAEALDGALLRDDAEAGMGLLALCRARLPRNDTQCFSFFAFAFCLSTALIAAARIFCICV